MSAGGDIPNFQPHQIAAAKLTVDRKVEENEISRVAFKLKPGS